MLSKNCLYCGKSFFKPYHESVKRFKVRHYYCSRKCSSLGKRGKPTWLSANRFNLPVWNKGKIGLQANEKNPRWKGEKATYSAVHHWIAGHLGKPDTCEFCGKSGLKGRKIHWANKDHKYQRNLNDWLRLCVDCHAQYDIKLKV